MQSDRTREAEPMIEFLINALNTKTLTMVFAAIAAAATVLTLAMPFAFGDSLDKRMKAVAIEREKIRQRERERMAQDKQKVNLRQSPKQYVQTIVDRFNLTKWVGQEEARLKLVQAGYRGQAPYVTYLFFRMVTPVGELRVRRVLSVRRCSISISRPPSRSASASPPPISACTCR